MWPSSFWPPSYWTPSYWPRPDSGVIVPPPVETTYPNLHAAIVGRCALTPALANVVTGGFWVGIAGRDVTTPYAVLSDVAESYDFAAGTPLVRSVRLQMTFFAAQPDTLKTLRRAFVQAFNPRMAPLPIADQRHVVIVITGAMLMPGEQQDEDALPLHMQIVELTALVSASIP